MLISPNENAIIIIIANKLRGIIIITEIIIAVDLLTIMKKLMLTSSIPPKILTTLL